MVNLRESSGVCGSNPFDSFITSAGRYCHNDSDRNRAHEGWRKYDEEQEVIQEVKEECERLTGGPGENSLLAPIFVLAHAAEP